MREFLRERRVRRLQEKRAGQFYTGPAAYTTDYALAPRPGFYALADDGRTLLADVPLVCVDDAPGNPDDGSCHYEYAGPKDPPQRAASQREVELRASAVAQSGVDL